MRPMNELPQRRLAAILAADVAGYSRLMNRDEAATLDALKSHRDIMDRLIGQHGGRIANSAGDSVLAEFPSAVHAVQCALAIQKGLAGAGVGAPGARLQFRIGVHVGDIMVQGGDVFGNDVNIAARLQAIARPGGVCISGEACGYVRKLPGLALNDLGPQQVKNIPEPIRAFEVCFADPTTQSEPGEASRLPLPDKPSIAVLPFTSIGGDLDQSYFAEGIVEDIIAALSRVNWLFVIARNSSFAYRRGAADVKQVGRDLGVRYILEGSIRKAGDKVRIGGRLIDSTTGHCIWADRFDGRLQDIFDLQDHITESVVGAIEPSIRLAEIERTKSKPTESLDAYDLYLRALPLHYSTTREGLAEAQRLLAGAIALDPSYSAAKGFAALTAVIQSNQGWIGDTEKAEGIRLAREVVSEGRDDPLALSCAGHALAYLARKYETAIAVLDRALLINPNSAQILSSAGWVRAFNGDAAIAEGYFRRAIRMSPLDQEMRHSLTGLGFSQLMQESYGEALSSAEKANAAIPSSLGPYRVAIMALVHLNRLGEAKDVAKRFLAINPAFTITRFREVQPFRDQSFVQRYLHSLQAAGLPQ